MIPHFLIPFEKALVSLQKECVKIAATPLEINPIEDPLELTESKFFGLPFLPKTSSYPKDKKGYFMMLIAQLNFEEIPPLENFPSKGILQLYLSSEAWYDEVFKVIYLRPEDLEKAPFSDFSFLPKDHFDESPILAIHQLKFTKSIDNGSFEDAGFNFAFNDLDWGEYEDTLNEADQKIFREYFDASGHKIGGYGDFTQNDPRDYKPRRRDDIQILQIDGDKKIIFGDLGVAHLFISKEDLINDQLENAYFYWDCY